MWGTMPAPAGSQSRQARWQGVVGVHVEDDLVVVGKGRRGRYFPRDGYTTMKFGWLGIFTFGRVCAFISSVSPMIPLR